MGVPLGIEPFMTDLASRVQFSGTICTLGVMDMPGDQTAAAYFSALGFSTLEALDVSAYEGAEHIFDLNDDEIPAHLMGRFDAVFNGGTLEHVFHVPNALTSITRMLRPGGVVIHILPCNGWVDHGFYQISPTLMFDYYNAAGFEPLASALHSRSVDDPNKCSVRPLRPGDLGDGLAGMIDGGIHLYFFAARRGESPVERPKPTQWLYSGATKPRAQTPWFTPYIFNNGTKCDATITAAIPITTVAQDGGHCWRFSVPDLATTADGVGHPNRSPILLMEDDYVLGPGHAEHKTIREIGAGAFSHWNDALYFSTSDNTDPNLNGRRYKAIIIE